MPAGKLMRGRRCVVLGAGGFVGSNLCRRLAGEGATVIAYGRLPRLAGIPTPWVVGEFDDADLLARTIEGADAVFHLLGGSNPSASNRDPAAELRAALGANLALVAAAARAGVGKVVFVSSGGTVYGASPTPLHEDSPTNPISAYGVGKLMTEKLLGLYRAMEGLDHTILRVANPYGPFQLPDRSQGFVATVIQRALDRKPLELWGDGSVVRDYLHIDDVCDALVKAVVVPSDHRLFNVGAGVGRSLNDVVRSVSAVTGSDIAVRYLPGRAADIPINILDIARAGAVLDWRPAVSWEDGLRRTAAWLSRMI